MDSVRSLHQLLETKFPDSNYEAIGKKRAVWKKREFLAFDKEKNTWSIKELNVFQRFFRWFKRYRSTHLRCVLQQINKEKDRLPLSFREKMVGLWRKAHPKDACPLTIRTDEFPSQSEQQQPKNPGGTKRDETETKPDETGMEPERSILQEGDLAEMKEAFQKDRGEWEDEEIIPLFSQIKTKEALKGVYSIIPEEDVEKKVAILRIISNNKTKIPLSEEEINETVETVPDFLIKILQEKNEDKIREAFNEYWFDGQWNKEELISIFQKIDTMEIVEVVLSTVTAIDNERYPEFLWLFLLDLEDTLSKNGLLQSDELRPKRRGEELTKRVIEKGAREGFSQKVFDKYSPSWVQA